MNLDKIYSRIKANEKNLIKDNELTFERSFAQYGNSKFEIKQGYSIPELNVDQATKIRSWIPEGTSTHHARFYRGFSIGRGTKPENDYFISVKIKNIGKHKIKFTNNFRQTEIIMPGEAKEINFLNRGRTPEDQGNVNFQFAVIAPGHTFSEELEFLLSDPFATYFKAGKYTQEVK